MERELYISDYRTCCRQCRREGAILLEPFTMAFILSSDTNDIYIDIKCNCINNRIVF